MADREAQSKSIAQRWAAAWSDPDPSAWLALYTPTATYIDHGFQITRSGKPILKRHFELWRNSIPDFVMQVDDSYGQWWSLGGAGDALPAGKYRFSVRTVNSGTYLKDLPSKKAFGDKFSFRGVVDFVIDAEAGLIEEVDEWYSLNFDKATDVKNYHTLEDFGT